MQPSKPFHANIMPTSAFFILAPAHITRAISGVIATRPLPDLSHSDLTEIKTNAPGNPADTLIPDLSNNGSFHGS